MPPLYSPRATRTSSAGSCLAILALACSCIPLVPDSHKLKEDSPPLSLLAQPCEQVIQAARAEAQADGGTLLVDRPQDGLVSWIHVVPYPKDDLLYAKGMSGPAPERVAVITVAHASASPAGTRLLLRSTYFPAHSVGGVNVSCGHAENALFERISRRLGSPPKAPRS